MSRKNRRRRRWGVLPLALALAFVVVAVPAAAKGPVFNQSACTPTMGKVATTPPPHVRAMCKRHQAAAEPSGFNGADAGILAAGLSVLVVAGGLLVATHRGDAPARPRMS
jgi:hypothetical protein